MKQLFTSPKFLTITIALIAIVAIPLTLIEIQSQQNLTQNAESIFWLTNQSASTTCAADGNGAVISATFINTESRSSSTAMEVTVKDQQTGKSVDMGTIQGGDSKTSAINTERTQLNDGSVTFNLSWADGHSGTDTRTASYQAVSNCNPTPTPTTPPSPTIPGQPTPTICPTLGPVKNVHIVCPNCQLSQSPSPTQ